MCGRFTLKTPRGLRYEGSTNAGLPQSTLVPRYNIAPSQEILAITQSEDERKLSSFVWGLIPSWSEEPKGYINARSETLELKRSFRESFESRRCLIPADGFYEWQQRGKSKQPHYFLMNDESPFAFAGIWDRWQKKGATITSCSIITTAANDLLATIHDRMPVILDPDAQDKWLGENDSDVLMDLLVPFPARQMKSFPVSKKVNYAKVDEPSLIEPVELVEEPENLRLF